MQTVISELLQFGWFSLGDNGKSCYVYFCSTLYEPMLYRVFIKSRLALSTKKPTSGKPGIGGIF